MFKTFFFLGGGGIHRIKKKDMKVIRFRPAYLVLSREELITRPRTEMANHPKSFGLIPESQIRRVGWKRAP